MARWVHVAAISLTGRGEKEENIEAAIRLLEQVAWDKPDLVCLPETFTGLGMEQKKWLETPEPIDGKTVKRLCDYACRHRTWVICPILLREGDKVFNAAVIIDRRGRVVGYYAKMFPTIKELEGGIRPGREAPSFETDFGRIGVAICFDLNFRRVAENLKAKGTELVCFVSMYPGGKQVQAWAMEFGFWILTAIASPDSMLVNPLGRIVAKAQPIYQPFVSARINLDCLVLHLDYNYPKLLRLKEHYGTEAELETARSEGRCLLTCHRDDRTVWDWVREFNLEPLDDYLARARREREKRIAPIITTQKPHP